MTDRKTEILTTTAELLETKGFSAFSYQDLADRLGLRKASLHHHFATKEQLGLALLDFYAENGQRLMRNLRAEADTPGELVRRYLDAAEDVLLRGKLRVCPMGVFATDAAVLPPSMLERLRAMEREHLAGLAEVLDAGRRAGEIQFLGEPAHQAALVQSILAGASTLARVDGVELFRQIVDQLKRSLGL